jgi:hypothetical protein
MADRVAFVNTKGASQKGRTIIRNLEHNKLARFDLIGNRRAVNPQDEIEGFDSSIFYYNSVSLERHII